MINHRKMVRHFHEPDDLHELTFSCYRRMPLLVDSDRCLMLAESVERAMIGQGFRLIAYVFMPEHVHLLVRPLQQSPRLDRLLNAIKRPFSFRIKQALFNGDRPLLNALLVRERPGVTRFRFWQEGGGYDRNLRSQTAVVGAIDYIHNNPVRRGLCPTTIDWRWSSARYHLDAERGQPTDSALPTVHGLDWDFLA